MIKKLAPCLGEHTIYAVLAPLSVTAEVAMEVSIPFIMARIVDVGIPAKDMPYILRMGGLMVLLAMLSLVCGALAARFSSVAGAGFAKNVRKKLFYKVQEFSFANVDKFSTASLVTRLTTDVTNVQLSFMMALRTLARSPMMLICAVVMAARINKRLTLIFLAAIPVLGVALAIIATTTFPRFQKMLQKYDGLNRVVQENLIGIRVVKAFVREDHESEKFRSMADEVRKNQLRAERILSFNAPVMQFVLYSCMISVAWFGGNMVIGETMLMGELMSFISYVNQILMSLMMLSMVFVMMVMSRASVARIVEVLDEAVDVESPEGGRAEVRDGSVDFENVSFSYYKDRDNPVLAGVNMHIPSGEIVGILGGTGSGKTTLTQLIPRLYDATEGTVRVGGVDVRDYDLEALRNAVAMVLQKNVLFSGTIRENLRWGNGQADDAQIEAACRAAQAHEFIMAFPDGYDTRLGQGGAGLSGGQKQRICIARALLKKPKIVILDDSTSAVDTTTDSRIRQAFREEFAETTAFIIAQRVASVMDADRILVMDEGRIIAMGDHETLLRECDIYREVYESQQKGAE